jgi:hypothetical protein
MSVVGGENEAQGSEGEVCGVSDQSHEVMRALKSQFLAGGASMRHFSIDAAWEAGSQESD